MIYSRMQKIIFVIAFVLIGLTSAKSQPNEFILPALSSLKKVQWRDSVYLFKQFQQGELIFDTGFKSSQKYLLNYNLFTERMDAISSKGDTAALKMVEVQHTIKAGGYVFHFFPKKGYLRILEQGKVSLATLDIFNGYLVGNGSNGYASHKDRTPLQVDNRTQSFEYDRAYVRQSELYLIANNKFYKALKLNLLKVYEENRGVVQFYLEKHPADFTNVNSSIDLIHFLNELKGTPENKIPGLFRVKAGDPISKEWRDSLYLFPQFREALVKTTATFKMSAINYNYLTGEMDYINDSGDTIQYKTKNGTSVSFDDRLFYKQSGGGFAEALIQGKETLYETRRLKVIQEENNPDSPGGYSKDDAADDRLCLMQTAYFFLDKNQRSWMADKTAFIRFFPNSRKQLEEYLSQHPVNFENKVDLIRLISFCKQF